METNIIKGKAITKFGSLGAFSDALNWKHDRLNRILGGKQKMTHDDMCQMIQVLGITSGDEIVEVFSLTS